MKRLTPLLVVLLMLFVVPVAWAAEMLDEKMPVIDWEMSYEGPRDAGHAALAAGEYAVAIANFKEAAYATALTYVRALQLGNAALAYLQSADAVKSRADAKDAVALYEQALALLDKADVICAQECVHETNCTGKRKDGRARFNRSLKVAEKLLNR